MVNCEGYPTKLGYITFDTGGMLESNWSQTGVPGLEISIPSRGEPISYTRKKPTGKPVIKSPIKIPEEP